MRKVKEKIIDKTEELINSVSDGSALWIGENLKIYFLSTMVDMKYIEELQRKYYDKNIDFEQYFNSEGSPIEYEDIKRQLYLGKIMAKHNGSIYILKGGTKIEQRAVTEEERELSLEGSVEGFVESIDTNINIIRQYYQRDELEIQYFHIGTLNKNRVAVIYDGELADRYTLNKIVDKMGRINAPFIQSVNELQQNLIKGQLLIPRMLVTYRPDRAERNLLRGKILIFLNGTPSALLAPATFHEHFTTVDDYYIFPIPALFLIALRYLALFLSIILPATYVAITSYNPEVFRIQLALSITASRSGVAYPSFIEVTFMLLMMEFLIEASLRLPKAIGQTATTVGGLILGQAATQAHLVSNVMIIIVALVAICNFMIPLTAMNLAVRVVKYGMLIITSFLGVFGLFVGLFALTCYGFSIYSFNTPFIDTVDLFKAEKIKSFFRREKL